MEKVAFVMTLKPGYEQEYKKRHDEIWPELIEELKKAGVSDYSIFYEERSNKLFAVLKRDGNHSMDSLPSNPVVKRWWQHMADIMDTYEDNEPVAIDLRKVFHLE